MAAPSLSADRLLLCSTRGVAQEIEFRLERTARGCRVTCEVRIDGCLPRCGPSLHTPLPDHLARSWMDSQAAKLTRRAAKFRPLSLDEQIGRLISTGLPADPSVLISSLLQEQLNRNA